MFVLKLSGTQKKVILKLFCVILRIRESQKKASLNPRSSKSLY